MPKAKKEKKEYDSKLPFFIGSDPEYLLFYGTKGLDTKEMLQSFFGQDPAYPDGIVDGHSGGYKLGESGDFGWDGAASTGELRPNAEKDINTHVNHIAKMLKTIHDKIPFIDITTLSIGSPIGGHIHLDSFIHEQNNLSRSQKDKLQITAEKILTTFLLPIAASDHRISALARLQGNDYGDISDIRWERKSKAVTAEVRGLTAEWMTTPQLAYATIAYIATVWHEIKINNKKLIKEPIILRQNSHSSSVHRLLLSDYGLISDAITKDIKKQIKTFKLYPQFKKEIDLILSPKKVYKMKEKVGWNINKGWGLKDNYQPTKKDLLNTAVLQEILSKENTPCLTNDFAVNYNDDYNVAFYAKAIADRVAALNWNLKHKYSLFGFKKGATELTAMNSKGNFYSFSNNQSKQRTVDTCDSMSRRYTRTELRGGDRISPKTGLTAGANTESIVIGLPYDIRTIDDIEPMIDLICKIEKGTLKALPAEDFTVIHAEVGKTPRINTDQVVSGAVIPRDRQDNHNNRTEQVINEQN